MSDPRWCSCIPFKIPSTISHQISKTDQGLPGRKYRKNRSNTVEVSRCLKCHTEFENITKVDSTFRDEGRTRIQFPIPQKTSKAGKNSNLEWISWWIQCYKLWSAASDSDSGCFHQFLWIRIDHRILPSSEKAWTKCFSGTFSWKRETPSCKGFSQSIP